MKASIGVIGGSGLYEMEGLKVLEEKSVDTPFGKPSDPIVLGELEGKTVAFLPRHGKGHRFNPTEINFRANIFAMKLLGVESILAVSAVGSMKEEIKPGHIVLVNQFIDRTRQRPSTFFEKGIVAHVSFADPVCPRLWEGVYSGAKETKATVHKGGIYVCIEGPMFSTRAESLLYRSWGVDVIGMTNYQEAKLAREAEICYTTIALSTDYDCWKEDEVVTGEQVVATMKKNVATAKEIIRKSISHVSGKRDCGCGHALKGAIFTDPRCITPETRKKLAPLVEKYL